jgi:hypothetical protein
MEDAGIFYEQLVYSCGHLVYIYRFGMLYQEKSGNPVLKSISEDERQKGNDGNFREEKSGPFSERQKLQGRNMTQRKKNISSTEMKIIFLLGQGLYVPVNVFFCFCAKRCSKIATRLKGKARPSR